MILKMLASRLVDILLIAAAVYFLFPAVFRRRKLRSDKRSDVSVNTNGRHKGSGKYDGEGEYVDYEEVK